MNPRRCERGQHGSPSSAAPPLENPGTGPRSVLRHACSAVGPRRPVQASPARAPQDPSARVVPAGRTPPSPPRRGKEFPADSARGRFLSLSPRPLTLPVPVAARAGPAARPRDTPSAMQSRLLLLGAPGGQGGPAARRVRLLLRQVVRGRPGGDQRWSEVRLLHAGAGADTGNPGTTPAVCAGEPCAPLHPAPCCAAWEGALPRKPRLRGSSPSLAATCWVTRDQALALSGPHSVARGSFPKVSDDLE